VTLIGSCRNVDFSSDDAQSFHLRMKCGSANDPVPLEKGKVKKHIYRRRKLTPVMPDEMERLVSELPRDRRVFQKN